MEMLARVEQICRKYNLINYGDNILVGVSGGPDSVCLLDCLVNLQDLWNLKLHVVHLNHGFRGVDAEEDSIFVQNLADKYGLDATIVQMDVKKYKKESKLSSQAAGHDVRYTLFESTARKIGANKIAIGHNANDVAETVLMHLLQGSGLAGLAGIAPRYGDVIRPIIEINREEIENYLNETGLKARIDPSNQKPVYLRNKIRLNLIPLLEREYNPSLIQTLLRTSLILQEEDKYIDNMLKEESIKWLIEENNTFLIKQEAFSDLSLSLLRRLIRNCWASIAETTQGLGFNHVDMVIKLGRELDTGKIIVLPSRIRAKKDYRGVIFSADTDIKKEQEENNLGEYTLAVGEELLLEEINKKIITKTIYNNDFKPDYNRCLAVFDKEVIGSYLSIRSRKPGDKIKERKNGFTKKIKDIMNENRIPKEQRGLIPIIINESEDVIWIPGLSCSLIGKPTTDTKELLVIEYKDI